MRYWTLFTATTLLASSMASHAEEGGRLSGSAGKHPSLLIPPAIQAEHKELHEKLRELTCMRGRTGNAAIEVEKLLEPHFVKEEQLALPPLGLLADLSSGQMPPDSAAIIRMTDHLKREMPQMLAEHKKVVAALQQLQEAANAEDNPQGVQFAKALAAHAALEEQVLYPSALLVGRYLNEKSK